MASEKIMRSLDSVEIVILTAFCIGAFAAPMIVLWVLQSQKFRRSPDHTHYLQQRVAELEAENQQIREQLDDEREET